MALERIEIDDLEEWADLLGKAPHEPISFDDSEVLYEPRENFVSGGKHYVLVQKQEKSEDRGVGAGEA